MNERKRIAAGCSAAVSHGPIPEINVSPPPPPPRIFSERRHRQTHIRLRREAVLRLFSSIVTLVVIFGFYLSSHSRVAFAFFCSSTVSKIGAPLTITESSFSSSSCAFEGAAGLSEKDGVSRMDFVVGTLSGLRGVESVYAVDTQFQNVQLYFNTTLLKTAVPISSGRDRPLHVLVENCSFTSAKATWTSIIFFVGGASSMPPGSRITFRNNSISNSYVLASALGLFSFFQLIWNQIAHNCSLVIERNRFNAPRAEFFTELASLSVLAIDLASVRNIPSSAVLDIYNSSSVVLRDNVAVWTLTAYDATSYPVNNLIVGLFIAFASVRIRQNATLEIDNNFLSCRGSPSDRLAVSRASAHALLLYYLATVDATGGFAQMRITGNTVVTVNLGNTIALFSDELRVLGGARFDCNLNNATLVVDNEYQRHLTARISNTVNWLRCNGEKSVATFQSNLVQMIVQNVSDIEGNQYIAVCLHASSFDLISGGGLALINNTVSVAGTVWSIVRRVTLLVATLFISDGNITISEDGNSALSLIRTGVFFIANRVYGTLDTIIPKSTIVVSQSYFQRGSLSVRQGAQLVFQDCLTHTVARGFEVAYVTTLEFSSMEFINILKEDFSSELSAASSLSQISGGNTAQRTQNSFQPSLLLQNNTIRCLFRPTWLDVQLFSKGRVFTSYKERNTVLSEALDDPFSPNRTAASLSVSTLEISKTEVAIGMESRERMQSPAKSSSDLASLNAVPVVSVLNNLIFLNTSSHYVSYVSIFHIEGQENFCLGCSDQNPHNSPVIMLIQSNSIDLHVANWLSLSVSNYTAGGRNLAPADFPGASTIATIISIMNFGNVTIGPPNHELEGAANFTAGLIVRSNTITFAFIDPRFSRYVQERRIIDNPAVTSFRSTPMTAAVIFFSGNDPTTAALDVGLGSGCFIEGNLIEAKDNVTLFVVMISHFEDAAVTSTMLVSNHSQELMPVQGYHLFSSFTRPSSFFRSCFDAAGCDERGGDVESNTAGSTNIIYLGLVRHSIAVTVVRNSMVCSDSSNFGNGSGIDTFVSLRGFSDNAAIYHQIIVSRNQIPPKSSSRSQRSLRRGYAPFVAECQNYAFISETLIPKAFGYANYTTPAVHHRAYHSQTSSSNNGLGDSDRKAVLLLAVAQTPRVTKYITEAEGCDTHSMTLSKTSERTVTHLTPSKSQTRRTVSDSTSQTVSATLSGSLTAGSSSGENTKLSFSESMSLTVSHGNASLSKSFTSRGSHSGSPPVSISESSPHSPTLSQSASSTLTISASRLRGCPSHCSNLTVAGERAYTTCSPSQVTNDGRTGSGLHLPVHVPHHEWYVNTTDPFTGLEVVARIDLRWQGPIRAIGVFEDTINNGTAPPQSSIESSMHSKTELYAASLNDMDGRAAVVFRVSYFGAEARLRPVVLRIALRFGCDDAPPIVPLTLWLGPPPPPVPVLSPPIVEGSTAVAIAAGGFGVANAPDLQTLAILGLGACAKGSAKTSGLALRSVAPLAVSDSCEGGIIGNFILVGGALILHSFVVVAIKVRAIWSSKSSQSWTYAMEAARFPSVTLSIASFAQNGFFLCGFDVIRNSADDIKWLGYLSVSWTLVPIVTQLLLASCLATRAFYPIMYRLRAPWSYAARLALPFGQLDSSIPRVSMLSSVVGRFRYPSPAWVVLNFASFLAAAPLTIGTGDLCFYMYSVSLGLHVLLAVCVAATRPFRVLLSNILHPLIVLINSIIIAHYLAILDFPFAVPSAIGSSLSAFGAVQTALTAISAAQSMAAQLFSLYASRLRPEAAPFLVSCEWEYIAYPHPRSQWGAYQFSERLFSEVINLSSLKAVSTSSISSAPLGDKNGEAEEMDSLQPWLPRVSGTAPRSQEATTAKLGDRAVSDNIRRNAATFVPICASVERPSPDHLESKSKNQISFKKV